MIQAVTQIVIAVKDLEEAIKSYEALGFQLTRRSKNCKSRLTTRIIMKVTTAKAAP